MSKIVLQFKLIDATRTKCLTASAGGRLTKAVEFNVRDQRTFRCAERALVVDARFGAFAPASVCAKAAVVTLRLCSSRHSACVPLFRSPNRKPKCDDAIALTR